MLKNYLKVAWRSLVRNRTFSIINITGLAVGLGCFLLIALYVLDELSFDRYYDKMYQSEQQVGKIAIIFSVLAIMISCLGMFGLATFVAEQRTKEVGIRKVLGASVQGIVGLLSAEFMRLVAIAFLIAAPFAWWIMDKWLQDFVYRVSFSWWIFLAAGLVAFLIALVAVSSQAVRAAMANPVRSLKTE